MSQPEINAEATITIILLNWNGLRFLDHCLSALMKQVTPNCKVIMVDNASRDGSVEFVTQNYPSVRIVENRENLGFAEGNNVGLRLAKGKYVILLNIDTRAN